jgi:amino acid transporter
MAPYTLMFPALLVLRRKFPDTRRPYRVPGGRFGAWLAVVLAETFVTLGLVLFLTVIPTGQSRVTYTAIVAGGGVATLLVGIWLSRRRRPAADGG